MQIYLTDVFNKKIKSDNLKLLSPRAKIAFLRFCKQNEKRALQTATADLLLKKFVFSPINGANSGKSANFEVLETPEGKPYIIGAPEFSISHGQNLVAVAVAEKAEGKIGSDVQLLNGEVSPALIKGVLSENETRVYNGIESAPDKEKYFYKTFTEKESYVKFLGCGLTTFPREITDFKGAKFLTKYVFNRNELYCLTVCAENILSLKINVIPFDDLI